MVQKKLKLAVSILLLVLFLAPSRAGAFDIDDVNRTARIECPDNIYITFKAKTFDDPVDIQCVKVDSSEIENIKQDQMISPIYKLTIIDKKTHRALKFVRSEAEINIPKDVIDNHDEMGSEQMIFFYDDDANDWINYNTTTYDKDFQGKLMHTGYFGVFSKTYENKGDLYGEITFYVVSIAIGISLVYVIIKK